MENGATIYLEASWALNTIDEREAMTTLCGTKGGVEGEKWRCKIDYFASPAFLNVPKAGTA